MSVKEAVVMRFIKICQRKNIKLNELATRSGLTQSTVYSMVDETRNDVYITTIKKL